MNDDGFIVEGLITDDQAIQANNYIRDKAPKLAQAKASRVYLEQFRKTKKALLINQTTEGTQQSRESFAYAHQEYQDLLLGLKAAIEIEEEIKFRVEAAKLKIEIYRTQQANIRNGS